MTTAISQGVKISIETAYQEKYSNAEEDSFMFAYSITIQNLTEQPIQLLRRKWFIFDSFGHTKIVEGEGVVGLQPIIVPNESYSYVSGCSLKSDVGSMRGLYYMQNLITDTSLEVEIPEFELVAPYKLN